MPSSLASGQPRRTNRSRSDATVSQISDQCGLVNPGLGGLCRNPVIGRKFGLLIKILPARMPAG
jgi:hypothetical protein